MKESQNSDGGGLGEGCGCACMILAVGIVWELPQILSLLRAIFVK